MLEPAVGMIPAADPDFARPGATACDCQLQLEGLDSLACPNDQNIIPLPITSTKSWSTCSREAVFYYALFLSWKLTFRFYRVLISCFWFSRGPLWGLWIKYHRDGGSDSIGGNILLKKIVSSCQQYLMIWMFPFLWFLNHKILLNLAVSPRCVRWTHNGNLHGPQHATP